MEDLRFLNLREQPELMAAAARWFSSKWRVPEEAYLECMAAYLAGKTEYGWYLCLAGESIVGGLGVIDNDFHERKDLTPNICAVYTEPDHRCRGIAGRLLGMAVAELRALGVTPVYLATDHTGFYERYGWEYLCPVQCDGEDSPSRMYIHRGEAMIRKAEERDVERAAALAAALWPAHEAAALAEEFRALLKSGNGVLFLASEAGRDTGFAQAGLRHDYVEGAESSPVGYLEGIYVREEARGRGVARGLLAACEAWAAEQGCREFASDCELDNTSSLAFHLRTGFTEANRIICFVKPLRPEEGERDER